MSDLQGKVVVDAAEYQALRDMYEAWGKCDACLASDDTTVCTECPTDKTEQTALETLRRIEEGRK